MINLLQPRSYYKNEDGEFDYSWAYDIYKKHEAIHWLPEEVELRDDIRDWNERLTPEEKNLLTQLFRFFTQADIDVADGYSKIYLPKLGNHPEVTMMMLSFGAREAIHIDAYSLLIETVGMPDNTYKAFQDYEEMAAKHEYVNQFNNDNVYELLKSLAVYSGFTEGMQLFSSFAILLNFERLGKMKGMCNIVRWSQKDESIHTEGMTRLFRTLIGEVVLEEWQSESVIDGVSPLAEDIKKIAYKMVELEDRFIDLCFEQGGIEGLKADEVKLYIRYIANKRWNQLGFNGQLYENVKNPLLWLDWVVNATEHTNFFEARPTEYSKATLRNDEEIQW